MNWLALIEAVVGVGAEVAPVFIKNPQSQKIEAVVLTTVEEALQIGSKLSAASAAASAAASTTATPAVPSVTAP